MRNASYKTSEQYGGFALAVSEYNYLTELW